MILILRFERPEFHSSGDEDAFFGWLYSIPGVERVVGSGPSNLRVIVRGDLTDESRQEFQGIVARYQLKKHPSLSVRRTRD